MASCTRSLGLDVGPAASSATASNPPVPSAFPLLALRVRWPRKRAWMAVAASASSPCSSSSSSLLPRSCMAETPRVRTSLPASGSKARHMSTWSTKTVGGQEGTTSWSRDVVLKGALVRGETRS